MATCTSWRTELAILRQNPVVSTKTPTVEYLTQDFIDSLLAELKRSNARNRDLHSELESLRKYDTDLKRAFDEEQDTFWTELQKMKSSLLDYSVYTDTLRDKIAKLEAQLESSAAEAYNTSAWLRDFKAARDDERRQLLERTDKLESQLERSAIMLFDANVHLERCEAQGADDAERFRLEILALKSYHAEERVRMQYRHRVECEEIREAGAVAEEENRRLVEQVEELCRREEALEAALESGAAGVAYDEMDGDVLLPSGPLELRRRASTDDCWPGIDSAPGWIDTRLCGYSARLLGAEMDIAALKDHVAALQERAMNVDCGFSLTALPSMPPFIPRLFQGQLAASRVHLPPRDAQEPSSKEPALDLPPSQKKDQNRRIVHERCIKHPHEGSSFRAAGEYCREIRRREFPAETGDFRSCKEEGCAGGSR
ncbi:hypothetical protein CONPUDRAFT_156901 [Coniophora puteana RWD-64-598 SS2]|uniref:Uncharacterized protein n=1 Tax=Coniophora puteana (strain RWD-64-598) TaxID=741705 RepID=A0A5M3MGH4_CONPW|nr:uncharacterized protein CONPUDRAFT_156901 [Coniophora puteana RWD-64-598 SS2]EIW77715.1 hypothetical protein CONPUDRAFT_156901 [Coniophora puteana RWD-64-598 SS2]